MAQFPGSSDGLNPSQQLSLGWHESKALERNVSNPGPPSSRTSWETVLLALDQPTIRRPRAPIVGRRHEHWSTHSLSGGDVQTLAVCTRNSADGLAATWLRRCSLFRHSPGAPVPQSGSRRVEIGEAVAVPELPVVDPMARLDFVVLLRARGPNLAVPDPGGFDPLH